MALASAKKAMRHGDRAPIKIHSKGGKVHKYTGQWEHDHFSGVGKLETADTMYDGEWQESKRHGFGTLYLKKDGKWIRVYKGNWEGHKRNV